MSDVEERDDFEDELEEDDAPVNTDQGPYTGQSMEIPQTPFQPEEIEVLGYDDDGEPITVDRRAEREDAARERENARQVSVDTTPDR